MRRHRAPFSALDTFFAVRSWVDCTTSMSGFDYDRHRNWPRCGQTMIMTVGPSGSGKTTWSTAQGIETVSSDEIRNLIHNSGEVPGDQSGIFRHVRASSSRILSSGRDVIVD